MDTLTIKGMKFHGFHGVDDHEKQHGNDFEVDVILSLNLSRAADSDEFSDAIDYEQIQTISKKVMNSDSVNLIEHLAYKIGSNILQEFPFLTQFEVRVRKLNPPIQTTTEYTEARMSWPR